MPEPQRVFLDWSEATATAAAEWLRARAEGMLILVPTQEAGRRLRRALGRIEPRAVLTPSQFLQPRGDDFADPLAAALALAVELSSPRAERCRALFPAGVPVRTFAERLALARSLRDLQSELAEHGFTIAAAADRLAPGTLETGRWKDLDRLVHAADESLRSDGLRERESARLALAKLPLLPAGAAEVAVVAVGDLPPIVALALENLTVPVTVLIAGPREPHAFDAWGRPLPAAWLDRDPGWSDFDAQVRLVASPDRVEMDSEQEARLEVGLLDRSMLPALQDSLGAAIHDPAGLAVSAHWLARTLGAFTALVSDPAFDRAVDLLRAGAVRAWLAKRVPEIDLEGALEAADKIRAQHFPATLRAAREWSRDIPVLHAVLGPIETTLTGLRAEPEETIGRLVRELAEAFAPLLEPLETELLSSARESIEDALDQWRRTMARHALPTTDSLHALRESLAALRIYPPRPDGAVEAVGWLELPWSDAPHLLLAGMNLGKVPAPLGGELLLGKSVRAALGLPGEEERHARDAYFLARLLALPRRVDVLVGQSDAGGSPLEPSPLLFAGAGRSLPDRVEKLFAEPAPAQPDPAWAAGWLLDPPVLEMPRAIAATDFQRYLDCPFTFYLRRVTKMETFEPATDELDAAQFGDLVHTALQRWALDSAASVSTDPGVITRTLDLHMTRWVGKNLGSRLSLPLRLQVDSARARLAAFARWQAEDRREGWRIRAIEQSFEDILGRPWLVDGWTISGRVDRLDENERDGRWRVIDYKTFDSADGPGRKHLRAFRASGRIWPPEYARVAESADWWTNLQLPLYRQLLVESGRDPAMTSCGYFNLPKTIAETGLQIWEELDERLQKSAMACARGVLADLARRRFWPPNPRAAYAEFAEFFPPDALRNIDPNGAFVRSCAA